MPATEMMENVNTLQQKFIEQIAGELFPGRRHSEAQKLCFQLRFHPLHRQENHDKIAKRISEKFHDGFSESSIAPTVSDVVQKLRDTFADAMRADGVPVDRLNAGKGRPQDISPWEIVYNWLWETEFPRRGWALSKQIATCALEELQMQPVDTDRRGLDLEAIELCEDTTIKKEQRYQLQVGLPVDGYLLLVNQGTSGQKYCICPSRAFHLEPHLLPETSLCIPRLNAPAKCLKYNEVGEEYFLAIVTEQPLKLSWVRPDSDARDVVVSEERLREIFQKVAQQPSCQVFYKTYKVIE
jgi:hypothetical protein